MTDPNLDKPPAQPKGGDQSDRPPRDVLDLIDQTVAAITDAEIEDSLRTILRREGYSNSGSPEISPVTAGGSASEVASSAADLDPQEESTSSAYRVVIVMPTYNERRNLEIMVDRIRNCVPSADLLIVDDNSPDGTGDLADKLAEADPNVQVMHRTEKAGLGRAYVAGFRWALECGYDLIVEMDADGSHRPEDLPRLLATSAQADAVIGSRYVPGGTVVNWPKSREFLSKGANIYNRAMLGVKVKDATGGFRVYRAATLQKIDLNGIEPTGYCFQIDMTLRVLQAGMTITEVPITFVERERGASKMSRSVIIEAFARVARWGISARLRGHSAAGIRARPGPRCGLGRISR